MTGTLPDQRTLPALLVRRARGASDARLALDVAGGVLATAAALWLRPPGWAILVAAATCFAAFGAWGIADRAIGEHPGGDDGSSLRALRAARGGAAVIGALAAVALGLLIFALALGTWIS